MLHNTVIAAIMMVLSAGTIVPYRLRCLPTQIQEVVVHGVNHCATRALTMAHLRLSHKMDLREVAPKFSMADEILDDIDIH